jgi:hypothetical protein
MVYGTEAETMPSDRPTLKTRLAHALLGDIIDHAVAGATVGARTELSRTVSVRVDDTPGWNRLAPAGPHDRTSPSGTRIRKTPSKPGARTSLSAAEMAAVGPIIGVMGSASSCGAGCAGLCFDLNGVIMILSSGTELLSAVIEIRNSRQDGEGTLAPITIAQLPARFCLPGGQLLGCCAA